MSGFDVKSMPLEESRCVHNAADASDMHNTDSVAA
jgi:hypothetical protein